MSQSERYVLIVYAPGSDGPGSNPVSVYGPADWESLTEGGHLLCDGSSGWVFIVVPELSCHQLSSLPIQPASDISVA